ncbi:MAG: SDR family NAD(P)-dependent oxidoreductase [Phycisphaera sp. RhM]|nr:SDR family NAD(P)-dependent oxidoreductase [Phycisphaera sp. RhM]
MNAKRRLIDKRILVTGGSRGLGRSLCRTFADHGAKVALTYLRDDDAATSLVKECQQLGTETIARKVCSTDLDGMESLARDLEADWGGIDVLVNNAGITQMFPLAMIDEEDWDHVMDVNVKGMFLSTKAVLPGMIRRRAGVILNIGSLAGARMLSAPVHYCTSKAAVKGFTQSMAKELSRHQIRVLCLAPGLLDDGMGTNVPETGLAEYLHHCSLGRVGTLSEAAELAAFMISDANSYMNGETIILDGGV